MNMLFMELRVDLLFPNIISEDTYQRHNDEKQPIVYIAKKFRYNTVVFHKYFPWNMGTYI